MVNITSLFSEIQDNVHCKTITGQLDIFNHKLSVKLWGAVDKHYILLECTDNYLNTLKRDQSLKVA